MSDTVENAAPLTDQERIWMTIGKLTTGVEALEQLHGSQASLINSLVAGRVQDATNARELKQRVADLRQACKTRNSRIKSLEEDMNAEWSRMKPAIKAVEALAKLLPDEGRCACAYTCDYRS